MLYSILIFVSLLIFLVAIYLFDKIYKLTKQVTTKWHWVILVIFILGFTIAYLFFGIDLLYGHLELNINSVITVTFFAGACFVLMCAALFYKIIKNLDTIIRHRTQKLEQQYNKNIRKEQEIQRLKDQFIFIATHELSAPVNATKWSIELLKENKNFEKKLTPDEKQLCQNIEKSNGYLISLVQDLLETSRIEYGTIKVKKEKFYLEKIIEQTIAELKHLAQEKNITIRQKQTSSKPVLADPGKSKEVIINLLTNAIKYNRPAGEIIIETKKTNKHLEIKVIDTGVGLTKEEQKKLFQKFSRIDNKETRDVKGTGLGLFITKQIVEKMGGTINVSSKGHGQGTTFTFTLPTNK